MICSLCGYEYDETNMACHAACPMSNGCAILCCPNCGYQVVDESKSGLAKLLRRLWKIEPTKPQKPAEENTQ
ncbi:MAG: hypothetical protein FJ030_12090 [Chloroflexi bacterium]|nr:hypothetical protein [Chloroflexota bacterium]